MGQFADAVLRQMEEQRNDAATAHFARQLEHIATKVYEEQFKPLKARQFMSTVQGIDPGADTYVWHYWQRAGMVVLLTNYHNELPNVTAYATENTSPIHTLGNAWSYSTKDMRRLAMTGGRLNAQKAKVAREEHERFIDEVLARGHAETNIPGLLNNANVTLANLITGTWSGATPKQIVDDVNDFIAQMHATSFGVHTMTHVVFPTASWQIVTSRSMSVDNTKTILEVLQGSHPGMTFDSWSQLDTADAGGTGPRLLGFESSSLNFEGLVPLEFTQHPPERHGLNFSVACESSTGGCVIYRPLSVLYSDDV